MRAAAAQMTDSRSGFVRLVASEPMRSDPARVAALLAAERPWAALREASPSPPGQRRFELDLRLRVGGDDGGLTTFRKAAFLDLGRVERNATGWQIEVGWQASSAAPLFPVFAGRLLIQPRVLRLDGLYAPPGGVVGRIADRLLLHVAANGTARWLLTEVEQAAFRAA